MYPSARFLHQTCNGEVVLKQSESKNLFHASQHLLVAHPLRLYHSILKMHFFFPPQTEWKPDKFEGGKKIICWFPLLKW